jgi:hypothetical protein
LPTAGGDYGISALRNGIAEQKLKLPELVAAAAERREVVALDVDPNVNDDAKAFSMPWRR